MKLIGRVVPMSVSEYISDHHWWFSKQVIPKDLLGVSGGKSEVAPSALPSLGGYSHIHVVAEFRVLIQ